MQSCASAERVMGIYPIMNDRPDHRTPDSGTSEWAKAISADRDQSTVPRIASPVVVPLTTRTAPPVMNLPRRLTPLVGREQELRTVRKLLLRDDVPLVTLTGPGGVGKTRLALETALALERTFPDGIYFVDLAPITEPALVPPAIAKALTIREAGDGAILDALVTYLSKRKILLILDNFERVTDAASAIAELLSACPLLKVVVTSRVSLHLSGEHQFPVQPLMLPSSGTGQSLAEVEGTQAVRLFVMRAQAAKPDFELTEANKDAVAAICRRLDGLPLAIELTAVRIALLPPSALLARLDRRMKLLTGGAQDHPARLRSMRDAIAWSYDFMTPDEQRLFRRLSVFVGGFPFDAVNALYADQPSGMEQPTFEMMTPDPGSADQNWILDGVASLLDQSVIVREDRPGDIPRFTMLETIREFAREELEASGESEIIRERHAAWCLELVHTAEAERISLNPSSHADRLDMDRDNVKAALQWKRDRGEVAWALRMASALWPMWLERSDLTEGRDVLAALLALPAAPDDKAVWAQALCVTGALSQALGNHDQAAALSRQALTVFKQLGDVRGEAFALNTLGLEAMLQGKYQESERLLRNSLDRFQMAGDPRAGAWAMRHMSSLAYRRGDVAKAATLAREGLVLIRQGANRLDIARLLLNLGLMAVVQLDLERAESLSQKALSLFRDVGDRWGEADALIRLGRVAYERGDLDQASEHLGASLSLFHDVGDPEGTAVALVHLGWVRRAQGEQPAAANHFAEGLALCRFHHHPSCVAWALLGDGAMALDRNDARSAGAMWEECLRVAIALDDHLIIATVLEWSAHVSSPGTSRIAAQMLGAASALRDGLGVPLGAPLLAEHKHIVQELRFQLGESSYTAAFEEGRSLPLDEATALSIDLLGSATSGTPSSTIAHSHSLVLNLDRQLTARERQVLTLIAEGMPDREIASALFISRRTVSHHVSVIIAKLGVTSRVGAATYAIRAGLV